MPALDLRLAREDATRDTRAPVPLVPRTLFIARDSTSAPSTSNGVQVPPGVIIALVITSIAILGVAVMISVCLRSMQGRRGRESTHPADRHSAEWMGVSSAEETQHTTSVWSLPEKAPQNPDMTVQPAPGLPRLSPNRRLPSVYALDMTTFEPSQDLARAPAPGGIEGSTLDAARVDSPTLPPSTPSLSTPPQLHVVTRKPVPVRLSSYTMATDLSSSKLESPRSGKEAPSNTVSRSPSAANSAMQQIWESGFHVQRRSHLDREVARASSIIDPHLFGEAKAMRAVIPDVPFVVLQGAGVEP